MDAGNPQPDAVADDVLQTPAFRIGVWDGRAGNAFWNSGWLPVAVALLLDPKEEVAARGVGK